MTRSLTILGMGCLVLFVLYMFNPFTYKQPYDVVGEMKHDHVYHITVLDSLIQDIKHGRDTIQNKSVTAIYKQHRILNNIPRPIAFDTIWLPLPISDTNIHVVDVYDTIKITCYDTIWLRDTVKIITKPHRFKKEYFKQH